MNMPEHADTTSSAPLPELTDERIDAIERALFADISRERTAKRARRGRWWIGGAAAAAVIVVAAVIAPNVGGLVADSSGGGGSAVAPGEGVVAPDTGAGSDMSAGGDGTKAPGAASVPGAGDSSSAGRDIITTATATVIVDDVAAAAKTVGDAAVAQGGYVESMSVGQSSGAMPVDPDTGVAYDTSTPYPYPDAGGSITVRVPSDQLSATMSRLSSVGEVTASSINRQDVTEQTVDLKARVEASQVSVDRLTELMKQATSVADLIAAETALADRQATLESDQAQLKSLESMVDLSSLTVTLQPASEPVKADTTGFFDGLVAGWNGLVATLNGLVIALGFLIPWLIVLGIAAVIVWFVVRLARRRRRPAVAAGSGRPDADADAEDKFDV